MDPSLGSEKTIGGGLEEIQSIGDVLTQRQRKRFKTGDALLGRYRILGELGQGGMGLVFRCMDETGGIEVAVKMLPPEVSHDSGEMEDVRENFRLVSSLAHPNIATVRTLEKDSATGEYLLVMELAQGVNLRQWRKSEVRGQRKEVGGSDGRDAAARRPGFGSTVGAPGGRAGSAGPSGASYNGIPLGEILPIIRQIASALDHAHEHKVVHRDIKPSNVMVDTSGFSSHPSTLSVKVLDFGLAAQIHTSFSRVSQVRYGTSGTGPYMAPEQWRGEYQDGATDQYALAVLAYELIAGHCPFESHETTVLKQAVLDHEPKRPAGLPETTWQALKRGLAKERDARFASCGDFAAALGGDKEKLRNTPNARKGTANGRKWTQISAGLVVLAGLAAAGAWQVGWFGSNGRANPPGEPVSGSVVGQSGDLADSGPKTAPGSPSPVTEEAKDEPLPVPVGFGHAKIETAPGGARVTLGGQEKTSQPVASFRDIPAGPQKVRIELEDYQTKEFDLEIPVGLYAETNVVLAKRQGKLDVETFPSGAAIWTNGVDSGFRTPWILTHDAGPVELKFTMVGHRAWTTNALVKGDETTEILGIALVRQSGAVRVVAEVPKEAQAFFNGLEKTVGIGLREWKTNTLPAAWDGLDCGEAEVQVEAPGFDSAPVTVVVEDQATTNAAVALTPKLSRIKITSNAKGAEIFDSKNNRLGKAGEELKLAPFITNALVVRAKGYEDGRDRFSLPEPDKRFATRNVVLEEIQSPVAGKDWESDATGMKFVWIQQLGIWVGQYEVTNDEFKQYRLGHDSGSYEGHSLSGPRQPVVNVNFADDALPFVKWLNDKDAAVLDGAKYRLPSEAEWQAFAQCGGRRIYPWGDKMPPTFGNYADATAKRSFSGWSVIDLYDDKFAATCPVEESGPNDWRLYGVGGNVWEMATKDGKPASFGAWRGASWNLLNPGYLRCVCRGVDVGSSRDFNCGFRLVLSR